jgi:fibronectin-binding autotransporter adhesin
MLPPWLRQLFKKRFTGQNATNPIRSRLRIEALEDRVVPAVTVWTNGVSDAANSLGTNSANARWSFAGNWSNGVPQPGDDVVFPVLGDEAKFPSTGQGGNFQWLANSVIDGDFRINNITFLDDNYHIDAFLGTNPTLTIEGQIFSNVPIAIGANAGLNLIGALATGATTLQIALDPKINGVSSTATTLRDDNIGILKIDVPIDEASTRAGNPVGIRKVGTGEMLLSGQNSYDGQAVVEAGTLTITNRFGLGTDTLGTTVLNSATLGVVAAAGIRDSLEVRGAGVNGVGALNGTRDPARQFSGNAIGVVGASTWTGNVAMVPSATFGTAASGVTISGRITGGGDLTKVGTGTLTLTADNEYSGNTNINVGQITITNNEALSTLNTTDGSFTRVASGATLAINGNLFLNETLFLNGPGRDTDGNNNELGSLRLITPGGAAATWNGRIFLESSSSIGVVNSGVPGVTTLLTITGLLGGAGNLTKVDQGALRFPIANLGGTALDDEIDPLPAVGAIDPYTGTTFVNNGTLQMAHPDALGPVDGGGIVVNNLNNVLGTLQVEGTYSVGKALTLSGTGFNTAGALSIVPTAAGPGAPSVASDITWNGDATILTTTSFQVAGPIAATNTLASRLQYNGVINGPSVSATLDRFGLGTLILSGNNTYLGSTILREGTTIITSATALGAASSSPFDGGTQVSNGATLALSGAFAVDGESLTVTGRGVNNGGVLQVPTGVTSWTGPINLLGIDANRADIFVAAGGVLDFNTVVAGDADLHKIGTGELRLTGTTPNSAIGATFVDDGTLALGKTGGVVALNGPSITIGDGDGGDSGDILRLDAPDQIPNGQPITVNETGLFNLNGNAETISGGTALQLAGGEVRTGGAVLTVNGNVATNGSAETSRITGTLSIGGATRTFNFSPTPTATLSVSANPVQFGSNLTLTFTATGPTVPGGNVQFFDGDTLLTGVNGIPLNGAGVAQFVVSNLAAGSHTIVARYLGDGVYPPITVTFASPVQVVNPFEQATLTSSAGTALPDQTVTFTYRIAAPIGATVLPTGTVTFSSNGVPIGAPVPLINGVASIPTSFSTPGSYTITARYNGDANFAANEVVLAPRQVVGAIPILELSTSQSPALSGTSVAFSFRASPAGGIAGVPQGTVEFFDGTVSLGTQTLAGGLATMSTSALTIGSHTIRAVYTPAAGSPYAPATTVLNPSLLVVNPLIVHFTANPNGVLSGQTVTYTFRANGRTGQTAPTGTVLITANGVPLNGGVPVPLSAPDANGVVTATATGVLSATSSVVVTADYSGDLNYAREIVTLNPAEGGVTSTFFVSSGNQPSLAGQPVTFTVISTANPRHTGTVSFFDGSTQFDSATLTQVTLPGGVIANVATGTAPAGFFGVGSHDIRVTYTPAVGSPYAAFTLGNTPLRLTQQVIAPIEALLQSSANPARQGSPVTFTFSTTVAAGIGAPVPEGTVQFFSDGTPIGTPQTLTGGVATYTTAPSDLLLGSHVITAQYSPSGTSAALYVPLNVTLGGGIGLDTVQVTSGTSPIQTVVSTSANASPLGADVTLTFATVASAGQPQATGTVTFFDGTTQIGSTLVLSNGTASITRNDLPAGVRNIRAVYSGDSNYAPSTTELTPGLLIVSAPRTQLTSSANPSATGQTVTFTANFVRNSPTAPVVAGSVQFFDDGVAIGGPIMLPANGIVTSIGYVPQPGANIITAVFTPADGNYQQQTLVLTQTVNAVGTVAPPPTIVVATPPTLRIDGSITGTGTAGVIKAGGGVLELNGLSNYPGLTRSTGTGVISLITNNAIPTGTTLQLLTGTLDLNGFSQTVASLDGTGGTLALDGGTLTTGALAAGSSFSGPITGTGSLVKVGTGTLTLSGASPTYTGTTVVNGGTVLVNANHGLASAVAQTGGTLGGVGTVGAVTVNASGTLAPGITGVGPGTLNTGPVTFNGGTFAADLSKVGIVLSSDALAVAGTLGTGSANPVLSLNTANYANPVLADGPFTILTTTGMLPAGFRFNRPDGTTINDGDTVAFNGRAFVVDYGTNGVTVEFAGLQTVGTFTVSANPSSPGDAVTITVTFAPAASGDAIPTGTVTFTDSLGGTTFVPISMALNGSGQATTSATFTTLGAHQITATFTADPLSGYTNTTAVFTQTVNIATATVLVTSDDSVQTGDAVTFTATVSSSGAGVPTGTVTFMNVNTGEVIGTAALNGSGQATITTTGLPVGTITMRAIYSGDATFRGSSADITQTVAKPPAFYTNAVVIGNFLVLEGNGVPGGLQIIPVPAGTTVLFTDINGDAQGDVILFLPTLAVVVDGQTGRFLALSADIVGGDGIRDLQIFNPDGTTTTTNGRTGITVTA